MTANPRTVSCTPRNARTLRVPNVAPGEYQACLLPRHLELSLSWGAVPEGVPCDSGTLAPGATLALKPGRNR